MGCGNGRRSKQQKAEAQNGLTPSNGVCKAVIDNLKITKNGEVSSIARDAATMQGSFCELTEEGSNRCLRCTGADTRKAHTLDCSHKICFICIKEQLELHIKTKQGNIIYNCKTCNAPKHLSTKSK